MPHNVVMGPETLQKGVVKSMKAMILNKLRAITYTPTPTTLSIYRITENPPVQTKEVLGSEVDVL